MEPEEISEFSKSMEEAGDGGMKHVALIISVLAVLVAMVTVLSHRQHTEAVLMQSRASDKWNEYQARKLRVQQVSVVTDLLTLQPSSNDAAVQNKLHQYQAQMEKWKDELDDAQDKAHEYEAEVDVAEKKAARYDLGEALLQIAVVMASVTLLTRQKRYVVVALLLGLCGLFIATSAFLVKTLTT